MLRRRLIFIAVLGLILTACADSDEADGGTLEVIVDGRGSGFGDFTTGGDKTFGLFICTNDGPVELESIEPTSVEGDTALMGAVIYTTSDNFVGAADGFPPDGIDTDKTEPLDGAVVDTECVEPEGEERVQILIGAERTGVGGGRIDGVVIGTSASDVEVAYEMLLCGDELEYCDVLENADA